MPRHTAKHELFATYLADGLDQTAAYIKAGFAARGRSARAAASRLVNTKPSIVNRRDELVAERERLKAEAHAKAAAKVARKFQLDREAVLEKMHRIYEMGTAAIPVLDTEGRPTGEYRTSLAPAVQAMRLLGNELHGMFAEREKGQGAKTSLLDGMTPEELRAFREQLAAVAGALGPGPGKGAPS